MKSTLTTLTFLVAALAIAPRPTYGQYAWVPVYTDPPAVVYDDGATGQHAWVPVYTDPPAVVYDDGATGQLDYASYIDTGLEDFDGQEAGCDIGCKSDCECLTCRHANITNRMYFGLEYMHAYAKGRRLPALVSGGQNPLVTPLSAASVLPPGGNAQLLFGGTDVGGGLQAGGRLTLGLWLDDCETRGVVMRGFGIEGDRTNFAAASAGNPTLGLPFFNLSTGGENALNVAYGQPAATAGIDLAGNIGVQASNDLIGSEIFLRDLIDSGDDYSFSILAGYQFTRIDDDLELRASAAGIAGTPIAYTVNDLFDVSNQYHAGTVGLLSEFSNGPLTLEMLAKVGIGNMRQTVAISGSNTLNGVTGEGGFFTQPSRTSPPAGVPYPGNIGIFRRDRVVFAPEANVKLTYCVNARTRITVGYSFMYWSGVALAGEQIDRNVDSTAVFNSVPSAPAAGPVFDFADTGFWVQTIDIGLLFNY